MRMTGGVVVGMLLVALIAGSSVGQVKDKRIQSGSKGWGNQKAATTDPKLPRVLLIGDSILNGYRRTVTQALEGKANVDVWINPYHQNVPGLCDMLKEVLANGPYDVIHFNMGLHGWPKGRIPEGKFEPLTQKYVQMMRENAQGASLIWASSTPVTAKGKPGELDPEINPIIMEHNAMAAKVMQANNIPINDLYQLMASKLNLAKGDQFHWTTEGAVLQGQAVAEAVLQALKNRKG